MIRKFRDIGPKIHPTAFIADNAVIMGDVEIGEESSVWFGSIVRGDVNYIRIGARTNIQDLTVIHVTSKTHPTILEDEITVGRQVTLHGCYVEHNCLIGIGAAPFSSRLRSASHALPGRIWARQQPGKVYASTLP